MIENVKLRGGNEAKDLEYEYDLMGEKCSIRGMANVEYEKGKFRWVDCVWNLRGQITYPVQNIMLDLIQQSTKKDVAAVQETSGDTKKSQGTEQK